MNRLWALMAMGFLCLSMTGCGGGGDMMAPEDLGAPTPEQLEAERKYAEETAKEDAANQN